MVSPARPEDFAYGQSGQRRPLTRQDRHLGIALGALRNIRDQESCLLADAQETARTTLEAIEAP